MLKGRLLEAAITSAAGIGFLLFGYDQGVMSGLLTGKAFTQQFPQIDTTETGHGSASLQGTVVAIYEIGCFFGAILAFLFGERLGRRPSTIIGCATLSVGGVLQASAYGIPQLIVGRIIAGLGNGLNTASIPVWHSELMRPTDRGRGLSIELAVTIFGVMLSYWIDYGMSYVDSPSQFRFPIAFQIFFAIACAVMIFFLPESPRWLIAHGQEDRARGIIWILSSNHKAIQVHDKIVVDQVDEIKAALEDERESFVSASIWSIFRDSAQRYRYRVLLGIGGQFMQQLSGINLITYYAPVIFQQSVGLTRELSLLLAGFNGIAYFLSSLIPIWCLDKFGRRKLMLFAVIGQSVCMAILAGTVSNGGKAAGIVAIVMLFLFNFFFAIGLLAIPWLLPAEYAPLAIRAKAAALATMSNWIFTFLVVEITPVSIKNIQWRTYIYFAVFNAAFVPLIYLFYPETRNLSLERIDRLFTGPAVSLHWRPEMEDEFARIADRVNSVVGEKAQEINHAEA